MPTKRPPIKLSVPVQTLLANAERLRDQLAAEHDEAWAVYQAEMKSFSKRIIEVLQDAAAQVARGAADADSFEWESEYVRGSYRNAKIQILVGERPRKPEDAVSAEEVDQDVALLRATTTETIQLTVDDHFARYLRP